MNYRDDMIYFYNLMNKFTDDLIQSTKMMKKFIDDECLSLSLNIQGDREIYSIKKGKNGLNIAFITPLMEHIYRNKGTSFKQYIQTLKEQYIDKTPMNIETKSLIDDLQKTIENLNKEKENINKKYLEIEIDRNDLFRKLDKQKVLFQKYEKMEELEIKSKDDKKSTAWLEREIISRRGHKLNSVESKNDILTDYLEFQLKVHNGYYIDMKEQLNEYYNPEQIECFLELGKTLLLNKISPKDFIIVVEKIFKKGLDILQLNKIVDEYKLVLEESNKINSKIRKTIEDCGVYYKKTKEGVIIHGTNSSLAVEIDNLRNMVEILKRKLSISQKKYNSTVKTKIEDMKTNIDLLLKDNSTYDPINLLNYSKHKLFRRKIIKDVFNHGEDVKVPEKYCGIRITNFLLEKIKNKSLLGVLYLNPTQVVNNDQRKWVLKLLKTINKYVSIKKAIIWVRNLFAKQLNRKSAGIKIMEQKKQDERFYNTYIFIDNYSLEDFLGEEKNQRIKKFYHEYKQLDNEINAHYLNRFVTKEDTMTFNNHSNHNIKRIVLSHCGFLSNPIIPDKKVIDYINKPRVNIHSYQQRIYKTIYENCIKHSIPFDQNRLQLLCKDIAIMRHYSNKKLEISSSKMKEIKNKLKDHGLKIKDLIDCDSIQEIVDSNKMKFNKMLYNDIDIYPSDTDTDEYGVYSDEDDDFSDYF